MALKKYKITNKEAAAKEYVFIGGNTKYITDALSDEEAAVLYHNQSPYITLDETYQEEEVKDAVNDFQKLISPRQK
jgi:hypothetical protein